MEVHIPEPEEGYHFEKAKKNDFKVKLRVLFFIIIIIIVISGLALNGFSFNFSSRANKSEKVESKTLKKINDLNYE